MGLYPLLSKVKIKSFFWLVIAVIGLIVFYNGCQPREAFDLIIKGGKVIDGCGNPWFHSDIGIKGERIAALGSLSGGEAKVVIDAGGLVVSPGFIDLHTHCDEGLGETELCANQNYLTQGVTTVVTGNCGGSPPDIEETIKRWKEQGLGTNAVLLVGLGTVRRQVIEEENRSPTEEELERMKLLVKEAMEAGAYGLSTGLQYIPDRYATTEEVIELVKVVAPYGGIFSIHQRDEEDYLLEAIRESINIGEATGVPVEISHLKAAGKRNWGKMLEAVRLIAEARLQGLEVYADQYPYRNASTVPLPAILNIPKGIERLEELSERLSQPGLTPEERQQRMQELIDGLLEAFREPQLREEIKRATLEGRPDKVNWVVTWGWDNFMVVDAELNKEFIGKLMSDIAQQKGVSPFDLCLELIAQERDKLTISLATMAEDDLRYAMRQPWLSICSDGGVVPFGVGKPHPRNYGSFPRVLGRYVREEGVLALPEAIRKMTTLPAQVLRLKNRGMLKPGMMADITIFHPAEVRDVATFADPHQHSQGIAYVLVNGQVVIEQGRYTGKLPGKVLSPQ